jgi:hypothetical protein
MGTRRQHGSRWYHGNPGRTLRQFVNGVRYRYPHRNLFVIGLPKSGTTWLYRMVAEVPGYVKWSPPYITWTDHTLRPETLERPPIGYTATKLHCRPTPEHLEMFNAAGRPYVVLYRDPRDVAVSWYFFAHNVATDPHADHVKSMEIEEGLAWWIEHRLPDFVSWIEGWKAGADPDVGLIVRYEDLLEDGLGVMRRVFDHYELGLDDDQVRDIVEKHSFKRATGRAAGHEDAKQFNRKGVAGDWRNHLTPELKAAFKQVAGPALIELGYAADMEW